MTVRYQPKQAGLEELARGPIAQELTHQHGDRVVGAAGDGFVASYQQGQSRYRGIAFADTWSAKHRNARENTLVRVLG